jgi:peptide chain release factor 1
MGDNTILNRLKGVRARFDEVGQLITDPSVISNMDRYVKLNREYKQLEPVVEAYEAYTNLLSNIENAKEILSEEKDEEMREMAKDELDLYQHQLSQLEEEIKWLLLPSDPEDEKSAIVEIRAGTGGDEASIFAGDLYRMYTKFFETKGWKSSTTSYTEGTVGGFKEIIMNVTGEGVYGIMKYE